ncbi:uncharacterized protein LOC116853062 isoform X2 [Odontomachus brunneus]|nr:uncharacterized protein LOC116853062 isoform X2 [Odontomachus brunneus]
MIEAEVQFAQKILMRIPDDNIIDNSMEILKKYGYFAACIEEDKGMIKDSKLVVDKIMAAIERNIGDYPVNKDFVKECVNALNEDSELTREERATDMERCMIAGYRQGQKEVIAEDMNSLLHRCGPIIHCLYKRI